MFDPNAPVFRPPQLEALVWHELDTVATLAARLHRGQRMLPDTFASYRPPPG